MGCTPSFERWRGVVGELLLFFGGALYAYVAEEEAGGDGGLVDGSEGVGYVGGGVVAGGDDVGAEAAVVEFVEDGSADELAGAVGFYAVEEAGEEFAAEGFDFVDVVVLFLGEEPGGGRTWRGS